MAITPLLCRLFLISMWSNLTVNLPIPLKMSIMHQLSYILLFSVINAIDVLPAISVQHAALPLVIEVVLAVPTKEDRSAVSMRGDQEEDSIDRVSGSLIDDLIIVITGAAVIIVIIAILVTTVAILTVMAVTGGDCGMVAIGVDQNGIQVGGKQRNH